MIDKEAVYDERISPLVQQIIEICKGENIPFLMEFGLREATVEDEDLYCLTAVYGKPGMMRTPHFSKALRVLKNDPICFGIMVENRRED